MSDPGPWRQVGWHDGAGEDLRTLGEEAVLRRLITIAHPARALAIPPGDDAAGWRSGSTVFLISTDSLVETVHFRRDWQTPYQVGSKAWAQAASDLAAMGAVADLGVIAAVMPGSTPMAVAEAIQLGLVEAAEADGAVLAGGDLSAGETIILAVTVVGSIADGQPVPIGGGRSGDYLVVTGALGGAAAALELLGRGDRRVPESWLRRAITPRARLLEGERLRRWGASGMTDISDGLVLDCSRMARGSGLGAELWVDRVPLAVGLAQRMGEQALRLAVTGGEDYELLVAFPPDRFERAAAEWPADLSPLRWVGRLIDGAAVRLLDTRGGAEVKLGGGGGYQHF